MKIATFNINGILTDFKRASIATDIEHYKIDILAIQETHLRGTGILEIGNKHTLHYTGPEDHSHHGVGFIVKNNSNTTFIKVSDRICCIKTPINETDKRHHIFCICVYAPTSKSKASDIEKVYTDLEIFTDKNVTSKDIHVICGDFNSKIGSAHDLYPENVGKYGKGNINRNGEILVDFLSRNSLIATNTIFKHKLSHVTT